MAQKIWKLFEPITIGKLTIKNRIYMPSMCTNYAGPNGESTIRDIGHYETKARGGAGLITVDYSLISPEGRGTTSQNDRQGAPRDPVRGKCPTWGSPGRKTDAAGGAKVLDFADRNK